MDADLDTEYIEWLYRRIEIRDPYWSLALQLHAKEFTWFIPHDDNRIEDGRELRYEFSHTTGQPLTPQWHTNPVSTLEVLIALSERVAFQMDEDPRDSFWRLMQNLGLGACVDHAYDHQMVNEVDYILETLIWRTYSYSGEGGLFPLSDPHEDQRKVELWYQMSAYVIDRL